MLSSQTTSHGEIIRSSAIIGGSSVISILLSIARTKAAALLVGPAGVGIIGLLGSFVTAASVLVGWGISNTGARQIAEAGCDPVAGAAARKALYWAAAVLALIGGMLILILADPIGRFVFGAKDHGWMIAWLSIAVALTVTAAAQTAMLTGLRRMADVAGAAILSAVVITLIGVPLLYLLGERGILGFVLLGPFATFLIGAIFVGRLHHSAEKCPFAAIYAHWKVMASLGTVITMSGFGTLAGQLLVRIIVQRRFGGDALGLLQASLAISATYLGFIFTALATDFYPRLVATIRERPRARKVINEQMEVSILVASPLLLITIGFSPKIIQLLYSSAFKEAAPILVWQIAGDVFKLASWPMAYALLAEGRARTYLIGEAAGVISFLAATYWLLPYAGVVAVGMAYLISNALYALVVLLLTRRLLGPFIARRTAFDFLFAGSAAAVTLVLAIVAFRFAAVVATVLSLFLAFRAFSRLGDALPPGWFRFARLKERQ